MIGSTLGYDLNKNGFPAADNNFDTMYNEAVDEAADEKVCPEATDSDILTVDELIDRSKPKKSARKGKSDQYERDGGFSEANKDFDKLKPNNVKEIDTKYGKGRVGQISEGRNLVVRPGSSKDGYPTLEINGDGNKIKFRYKRLS